jgi:N-acetylneuraminic acid mutarotase
MDRWTLLASMPRPVNHAAGATDGRRFWIFGGRGGDNVVSNGYDTVQVYDSVTATWATSFGSIAPLPQARGGMGRAIYLNDEFYVMGGETATGAGATAANVYARVDVYNPATNTWRRTRDMGVARHGIYPVEDEGRIYVACGGDKVAASKTPVMEILDLV